MTVYVLIMNSNDAFGHSVGWDVFGIYSAMELAEQAKEWRRRSDGLYQGVRDDLVYKNCFIVKRIIDHNLPK